MGGVGIQLSLLVLMPVICLALRGQFPPISPFPEKYRNPGIQWYFRYILCRNTRCGFEELCESQTMACLVPPCMDGPRCVAIPGGVDKGGRCPLPSYITTRYRRCNTDLGCPGNQLCCHGFRGSQCSPFFPSQN